MAKVQLNKPWDRERVTLDWAEFAPSFLDEVRAWENQVSKPHPFDEDGPVRPLRPLSVKTRTYQILQLASALAHQGHRVEDITSLAYLVDICNFKDGLRHLLVRTDDKPNDTIHNLAIGIKAIARHHVRVPPEHLEKLGRICSRLNPQGPATREKNRQRLEQFDDTGNLAKLLHLPQ